MAFRIRTIDLTASGREIVREREHPGDELVIGRATGNAIHLPDLAVEQEHVRVLPESAGRLRLPLELAGTAAVGKMAVRDEHVVLGPGCELREWLERDGGELVADFDRLYVPRNDPMWLRRNALVAAGNVGTDELVPLIEPYASDDDPVLRETAAWALSRIAERTG